MRGLFYGLVIKRAEPTQAVISCVVEKAAGVCMMKCKDAADRHAAESAPQASSY